MYTIASVTSTVSSLMKLNHDLAHGNKTIEPVIDNARQIGVHSVKKVLIYAPDALGEHLHGRFHSCFEKVKTMAPISIDVQSIYPTLTPVCFATMFIMDFIKYV